MNQVAVALSECLLYSGNTEEESPIDIYLKNKLKPILYKCIKRLDKHPRTTYDTFIDIFNKEWEQPGWAEKEELAQAITKGIRVVVNLHAIVSNMVIVSNELKLSTHGLEVTIDLIIRAGETNHIILFDFNDRVPNNHESIKMSYELQAAARAYDILYDDTCTLLSYVCLMNGAIVHAVYEPKDRIEVIAQIIDQGGLFRRRCLLCSSCSRPSCTLSITDSSN